MREYETVIITRADLSESDLNQIHEKTRTMVEKREGRFFYARNMGRRNLAYPIRKQGKGVYTCYDYAASGNLVSEMERSLRLDDNVLRFLTVVKNEDVDVEARAAEIVARGEDKAVATEEISAKPAPGSGSEGGEPRRGEARREGKDWDADTAQEEE